MKRGELAVHGQDEHERMLRHGHGIGTTIRADRHADFARPLDVHLVVASAEHLHQFEAGRLSIRFIG